MDEHAHQGFCRSCIADRAEWIAGAIRSPDTCIGCMLQALRDLATEQMEVHGIALDIPRPAERLKTERPK